MLLSTNIEGVVFSGEGVGASFIVLPWVRGQIKKKFGFNPHPGTLNLHLVKGEAVSVRSKLEDSKCVEIKPRKGFYRAHCFPVVVSSKVNGCILIPEKPDYPLNILEVVSAKCLRDVLSLNDGDKVELSLIFESKEF